MDFLDSIETPSVVIDMEKVHANLKAMAEHAKRCGCALRPHVKTHKMPELARLALAYGACGITCAKVSEAEVMADGGIRDIFIAYPLAGDFRIRRAAALSRRVDRLIVATDSPEGAKALSEAAVREGVSFEVRLEVDTGLKRTGAAPEHMAELARDVAGLPGIRLTGIFTFRGLVLDGRPTQDNAEAGRQEGRMLSALAARLRSEGLDIRDVSGGSSPTGRYVAEVEGITEIRPGTYIFNDWMQVLERACAPEDCAATVLVTVVSVSADRAVVDGGSKTFATDFAVDAEPFRYPGYAVSADDPGLVLARVNEEHGMLASPKGVGALAVGQRVRLIPVHVCSTVNLHNHVWFLEDGSLRKAPVAARGMLV